MHLGEYGILFLEENPKDFMSYRKVLKKSGYTVYSADSLEKAAGFLSDYNLALVVYADFEKGYEDRLSKVFEKHPNVSSLRITLSVTDNCSVQPAGEEHDRFSYLGPISKFLNKVQKLVKYKKLKDKAEFYEVVNKEVQRLQEEVIKDSREAAFKKVLDYLENKFRAQNCYIFLDSNKEVGNRENTHYEYYSSKKKDPKFIESFSKKYNKENVYDEKLIIDEDQCVYPILRADKKSDQGYIVFQGLVSDKSQNEIYVLGCVASVIKILCRLNEVEKVGFVDEVSGLYNQRYLHLVLDKEIEKVKRYNNSFCVLFIDVDHFKSVNDSNGHLVGSQILKEVGQMLRSEVRSVDYCFRYGGDEFLIVLTDTQTKEATFAAERIRKMIEASDFVIDGAHVKITLSIGIACFPEHAQTKKKIIQVADEAMYCGKNLTRNIVYVAS